MLRNSAANPTAANHGAGKRAIVSLSRRFGLLFGPTGRLQGVINEIGEDPRNDQQHTEGKRTHSQHLLALAAHYRKAEQQHGKDTYSDSPKKPSGHTKRPEQA